LPNRCGKRFRQLRNHLIGIMMFGFLRSYFSNDLAIDLGTANTPDLRAWQGIVLNEPSVVAIRTEGGPNAKKTIQAVGMSAKQMLGKTPGNITAIRPMKDGVIADFTMAEQMLQAVHQEGAQVALPAPFSPRVLICVPYGSTQVERRAIKESAGKRRCPRRLSDRGTDGRGDRRRHSGARGARIDGRRYRRRHLGSRGDLAERHCLCGSVRIGGDKFDEAIINYVRRNTAC
jgi:rod shape-determining protein MreB